MWQATKSIYEKYTFTVSSGSVPRCQNSFGVDIE